MPLKDKVAVICRAGGYIGSAVARHMVRQELGVILTLSSILSRAVRA